MSADDGSGDGLSLWDQAKVAVLGGVSDSFSWVGDQLVSLGDMSNAAQDTMISGAKSAADTVLSWPEQFFSWIKKWLLWIFVAVALAVALFYFGRAKLEKLGRA